MKVMLIETMSRAYRANPFSQMDRLLEPLAIEYIGAHIQDRGHEVELIQQLDITNGQVLVRVIDSQPDVVGFSCMTYSYPETVALARAIKNHLPRTQTVLGGYHVLGMESGPECFDFVIKGEGELAMEQILKCVAGKIDLHVIPGLLFYKGERWDIPLQRMDMGQLKNPLRLPRDRFRSMSMGENLPGTRIACVVAGRGCPYRCDFCCTPQLFPGRRTLRPVEDVVSEIIRLRDEMGVNNINLRDETFTPHKDYVRAFCHEMIRRRASVSWRAFANIGNLNKELVQLMAEAGCHMLFYGIEASDPTTLKIRRKDFHSRMNRIVQDVRQAQEAGIYVRGGFMVGHENDTRDSFTQHEEFLREVCPDELYVSFLTPFPGTPLFQAMQKAGRLLTTDFRLYDCEHPIVDIGIPTKELVRLRLELYRRFYMSREWTAHVLDRADRNPHERDAIQTFCDFIARKFHIADPFDDRLTVPARAIG